MKTLRYGLCAAMLLAIAPQPASAQLFDGPGPLCALLSIGCPPPPPPPPPAPEPIVDAPAPKKHRVHKAKPKAKPAAEPKADAAQ